MWCDRSTNAETLAQIIWSDPISQLTTWPARPRGLHERDEGGNGVRGEQDGQDDHRNAHGEHEEARALLPCDVLGRLAVGSEHGDADDEGDRECGEPAEPGEDFGKDRDAGRADVDTAMTVLRYKSAKYSIERPLHIGAALAGAGPDTMAALSAFGLPLGEAFQLRDDLLGVFGDPDATGKPAGGDLIEGKRTVLVALALDAAPPADAARLDAALGSDLSAEQVAGLRAIIDGCGAHAQVEAVIGELADHAVATLDKADLDESARAVLRELASAATQRVV
jgi:geranylgeranyl pyrophosphate synthase